jgi:hypothetical protein
VLTCKLPLLTEIKQKKLDELIRENRLVTEMAAEIGIGHHVVQEIAASLIQESMFALGSSLAKARAQTSVQNVS